MITIILATIFILSTLYTASWAQCIEAGPSDQCPLTSVSSIVCTDASPCCCGSDITCNGCGMITLSGTSTAAGETITGTGNEALVILIDGPGAGLGTSITGTPALYGVQSFTVSSDSGFQGGTLNLVCYDDSHDTGCPVVLSGDTAAQWSDITISNANNFQATGDNSFQNGTALLYFTDLEVVSTFSIDCTGDNSCARATITFRVDDCWGGDAWTIAGINCIGDGACEGTTIDLVMGDSQCTLNVGSIVCGDGTNSNDCDGLTILTSGDGPVDIQACTCNPDPYACTGATQPADSGIVCLVGATDTPTQTPTQNPSKNPTQNPSQNPTQTPTQNPTKNPTQSPTKNPTAPSGAPSKTPSSNPSDAPTKIPSTNPTKNPSQNPSQSPSQNPSKNPTAPSDAPSKMPSSNPSDAPTKMPSTNPSPVAIDEGNNCVRMGIVASVVISFAIAIIY